MNQASEPGSLDHEAPTISVVLSHKKELQDTGRLHQLEHIAKVISLVALPFVVALGGWWVQRSLARQAVNKDYVALAVSLLDDSREVPEELRGWAVDMLNRNAPIAFADSVSNKLRTGELNIPRSLDARQAVIRSTPTNLTRLIAEAMIRAAPDADLAIFNTGAIRIDSVLPVSTLSVLTVVRMLPFGNDIYVVSMSGRRLEHVLQTSARNAGTSNFMHTANVDFNERWRIAGEPINPNRRYTVATIDFLVLSGAFGATPETSSDIILLHKSKPMVDAVIDELLSHVTLRH